MEEIPTPRKHEQGKTGIRKKIKIPHYMDNPRWGHKKSNRLHHDQCEVQGRCQKGTEQHILTRQHEPDPAAPSPEDATIL